MENICSVCFIHAELYHVTGYTLPMCLKCSEQFSAKSTLNFYQNLTLEQSNRALSSAANTSQQNSITNSQPAQSNNILTRTTNATIANNISAILNQTPEQINAIKEQADLVNKLEHSLIQNGDNELLYGEDGTCTICSKTFTRKSALLSHMRNHSVDRKFICSYCQKGFTQAANLRNHERIHRNERPYICNDCGKAFTQVTNLNNHRRLHTGERPFVCIEANCGRAFAQVTNLNNHMKTHHKIQQYVCNQCPKKFTQVTSLNQHLLVHSGVRGFFCPQCPDKTFKQQSHLTQHMKTHGVFPFKCNNCDQKFLQMAQLKQHMKTHDDFKYKCNICFSAFNQEMLLKKHMQRHIDERQILCPIPVCNEVFTDKDHLTKHVEIDHNKNDSQLHQQIPLKRILAVAGKFNCYFDGCCQFFETTEKLNEHLMTNHNMLYKDVEARNKMNLIFLEQIKHQMTEQYVSTLGAMNGGHHLQNINNKLQNKDHFGKFKEEITPVATNSSNHTSCICTICYNTFKSTQTLARHICRFHGQQQ